MKNVSTMLIAKRHIQDGTVYAYLAPADMQETLRQDFSASTYAMETECKPMSRECNLGEGLIGVSTPFNCTANKYAGDIQSSHYQSQYYTDADLTDHLSSFGGLRKSLLLHRRHVPDAGMAPPRPPPMMKPSGRAMATTP
jgi:hypothetical protein